MKTSAWSGILAAALAAGPLIGLAGEDWTAKAARFGLDPTAAGWETEDADGDGLDNLTELRLGTDPRAADTDRDGFADGEDDAPLSRAYIEWGEPRFTEGDAQIYPGPAWLGGALRQGGEWGGPPRYGWQAREGTARLIFLVNGELAAGEVTVELEVEDGPGGVLLPGWRDAEGQPVAGGALGGNLLTGAPGERTVRFTAPFGAHPEAAVLTLERRGGAVTVYRTRLYIDEDGDGLDREQEAQLGTSDRERDSDGDGLDDYAEVFVHGTDPTDRDTDGDGMPDGWEVRHGLDPLRKDGHEDADGDGVTNYDEYRLGRDPRAAPKGDPRGVTALTVGTPLEAEPGADPRAAVVAGPEPDWDALFGPIE